MEIPIAATIKTNNRGLSEIKFSEMGSTGWIVGPATEGKGSMVWSGPTLGVVCGVFGL